jgi:hypothetical protein
MIRQRSYDTPRHIALVRSSKLSMSGDGFDLIRGSGNVYRDLERPHLDLEQARALVAAQIVRTLDARSHDPRCRGGRRGRAQRVVPHPQRPFAAFHARPADDHLETLDGDLEMRLVLQSRRTEARAT